MFAHSNQLVLVNPKRSIKKVSKRENENTYVDSAEIAGRSVPNRKDDPFPEDLEIEVYSFLAGLVHLWIFVAVLVVDVLFE